MATEENIVLVRAALLVTVALVIAPFAAPRAAAETAGVPARLNIHIDAQLRPVVAQMLRTSATFRRQWDAIAREERVHVAVFMAADGFGGTCRAKTTMRKYSSGLLLAVVQIPPHGDYAELVAHELEHVLEQAEGVNLAALAADGSNSARRRADGAYETARAQRAGRTVAAEMAVRAE